LLTNQKLASDFSNPIMPKYYTTKTGTGKLHTTPGCNGATTLWTNTSTGKDLCLVCAKRNAKMEANKADTDKVKEAVADLMVDISGRLVAIPGKVIEAIVRRCVDDAAAKPPPPPTAVAATAKKVARRSRGVTSVAAVAPPTTFLCTHETSGLIHTPGCRFLTVEDILTDQELPSREQQCICVDCQRAFDALERDMVASV
jgi:hypothetical protein